MGSSTAIGWTDATWNPTYGCSRVSPGCDHCYAMTLAHRFTDQNGVFAGTATSGYLPVDWTGKVNVVDKNMTLPLRWQDPRMIFVNSQSDLFHAEIPDKVIARVFAVMALAPRHTFQVLTKRHGRMRNTLASESFQDRVWDAVNDLTGPDGWPAPSYVASCGTDAPWPLPNVWMGCSVEDQKRAELRIPALLETPAAIRFLSCEPLLGPLEIEADLYPGWRGCASVDDWYSPGLDWIIVGGESGPGARRMDGAWVRDIRDQCAAADVPLFFKQWGEYDGYGAKIGKKAAGNQLDGRHHESWPEAR